jgi:serine/threonine-protein kinase
VDPLATVKSRCVEIGLDATVQNDPAATILARSLPSGAPASTVRTGDARARSRDLPKISVELRGTLSEPGEEVPPPSTDGRDLEVIATLGEGGMGRVFLARQHSLDRDVAIKTIRDRASDRERAALLSEGAIAGSLEHPSIIPVHALGVDEDGRPVLVMKHVEGITWTTLLAAPDHSLWQGRRGGEQDRLQGHLEILMQVCNAVQFAHERGILHRDIKPQNVLLGRCGEVLLADWGVALRADRGAHEHHLCGTPAYMAPEMATGAPVDARTDVYLLGATLHEILTGTPRHRGATLHAVLVGAIVSAPIAYASSVPEELAALANRATSGDPNERPASAVELRQAIADYLHHRSSIALGRSAVERLETLRSLTEGDALGDASTQRDIDLTVAEARFALRQALEQWSGNPVAQQALADLEALLAARRARAASLEHLARELDPRTSRRQRSLASAGLALVGVGLSALAILGDRRSVTPRGLLHESLAPLAMLALAVALLRRHLLRTAINRRAVVGVGAAVIGITVSRVLGVLGGVSAAHVLVYDSLLVAVVAAVSAAVTFRWVAWCALIMLAAAIGAAASPERAMLYFSLGSGVGLIAIVGFTWKQGDGSSEPSTSSRAPTRGS